LTHWVWAETAELITYYPTTVGIASTNTDSLTIGSTYSDETPSDGTLLVADRVGIGTNAPQGPLHAVGVDDEVSAGLFKEGTDTAADGTPEIRIGIGTDSPQQQLHLTGNLRLPLTTATSGVSDGGVIYFGTNPFIHVYGTDNTFIGPSAGNFTLTTANAVRNTGLGASALASLTTGSDNTAIGYQALTATTTGQHNVAVGSEALLSNTTGSYNVAAGSEALENNTTGEHNVAVGRQALQASQTADSNTAVGAEALTTNTDGTLNVAVGYQALQLNTTGSHNTAVGTKALQVNTTGQKNTAVGTQALGSNTTASNNTAVGHFAMSSNTTGIENSVLGFQALKDNTSGSANVACGAYALEKNTTASDNVAIGTYALYDNNGGSNVAVGKSALEGNTTGANNVALGFEAGSSSDPGVSLTGSNNIFIGYQAGRSDVTVSDRLFIENSSSSTPLIYGEFDNDLVTINGNLGIKTKTFGIDAIGVLAIANGTVPATSPEDQIQLYAQDVNQGVGIGTASSELFVRDEAGNVTTLSPHNFSLIPQGPSEPMAWSFYSERGETAINIDMLKVTRLIENLTGEQVIYLKTQQPPLLQHQDRPSLKEVRKQINALKTHNHLLQQRLDVGEKQFSRLEEALYHLQERAR